MDLCICNNTQHATTPPANLIQFIDYPVTTQSKGLHIWDCQPYTCTFIYFHLLRLSFSFVEMFMYVCLYIHVHKHICIYVCVCACMHTYMCTKNTYAGSAPRSRSRNCRLNWLLQRRGPWDSSPAKLEVSPKWIALLMRNVIEHDDKPSNVGVSCVQTNPCWTLRKWNLGDHVLSWIYFSWNEATNRHEKIRASERIEKGWKRKRILKQKGHLCSTRL